MRVRSALAILCVLLIFGTMGSNCTVETPPPPVGCETNSDCYDNVDCTEDVCVNNNCDYLEDDDRCPTDQWCDMRRDCVGNVEPPPPGCRNDAECEDGLFCTMGLCESGECSQYDGGWCGAGYYCDLFYDCQPVVVVSDFDGDGWEDALDNCWDVYNPWQEDFDWDGWGDVCDCDADGDWYDDYWCYGDDCNDYDWSVNPGAIEWCDWLDNDCNGWIDDYCY